jgi:hypothetical protein
MKRKLFVYVLMIFIGGFFAWPVVADDRHDQDTLVKFKGGIGVHPISNVTAAAGTPLVVTAVNQNIVRGVNPAGQIWVIDKLEARVKTNGEIKVKAKGLILAGGNSAGRATGQNVFATLICEAAAPFIEHSTDPAGVPLSAEGDFEIDDVLDPPPSGCDSPMLLIRNAAGAAWFAASSSSTSPLGSIRYGRQLARSHSQNTGRFSATTRERCS